MVYTPLAQSRLFNPLVLHVRAAKSAEALISLVRAQVWALDPDMPVFHLYTVEERVQQSLAQEKLLATLAGLFGGLALVLAAVGLYAAMTYAVGQKTKEIGIRVGWARGAAR